jgi:hypothetical protein
VTGPVGRARTGGRARIGWAGRRPRSREADSARGLVIDRPGGVDNARGSALGAARLAAAGCRQPQGAPMLQPPPFVLPPDRRRGRLRAMLAGTDQSGVGSAPSMSRTSPPAQTPSSTVTLSGAALASAALIAVLRPSSVPMTSSRSKLLTRPALLAHRTDRGRQPARARPRRWAAGPRRLCAPPAHLLTPIGSDAEMVDPPGRLVPCSSGCRYHLHKVAD